MEGQGSRTFGVRTHLRPYASPSPEHTSDSDDTWEEKQLWRALASHSIRRWKRMVRTILLQRITDWLRIVVFRARPGMHVHASRFASYLR